MPDTLDISPLFPACVATACRRVCADAPSGIYPEEALIVERAVEKRRNEFSAGRVCARGALEKLGMAPAPVLHSETARPVWPQGIVGTISHSHTWAGSAVAHSRDIAGIGLDIETIDRVTMAIARKVLTQEEVRQLELISDADSVAHLALIFSAKESVYKCLSSIVAAPLGFQHAQVRRLDDASFEVLMSGTAVAELPACARLTGRFFLHEGCIFTGIALAA